MMMAKLIEDLHTFAEARVGADPATDAGRQHVADALLTVAVAHKLRAGGAAPLVAELRALIGTLETMQAADEAIDRLLAGGPAVLHNLPH